MRFADYLAAFNRYDDAALIRDFWAEDCTMETAAGRVMRGQAEVLAMLDRLHDGLDLLSGRVRCHDHHHRLSFPNDVVASKKPRAVARGLVVCGERATPPDRASARTR